MAGAQQEGAMAMPPSPSPPPPLDLWDAHCHLQDERIPAGEVAALLAAAARCGVARCVVNGCWPQDWARVLQLAADHPGAVLPQLGLHPWWVGKQGGGWLEELRRLLEENPAAGLGECGLDTGPKAAAPFDAQLAAFEAQLALAQELRRPVSVHCVRAYGAIEDALKRAHIDVPVVLHAWTGSAEATRALLRLPAVHLSLNGYLAKLSPQKALPMVRAIPLDRLLLESDSPDGVLRLSTAWLAALPSLRALEPRLQSFQEGGNAPAAVACVLSLVAAARGEGEAVVAAAASANAERIFGNIGRHQQPQRLRSASDVG